MTDRPLNRLLLLFLTVLSLQGVSLESLGGRLSLPADGPASVRCVEASLTTAFAVHADPVGEGRVCDGHFSPAHAIQEKGPPDNPLPRRGRILPSERLFLEEGFHTEIFRPPVPAV
jgi:hypothetical protein